MLQTIKLQIISDLWCQLHGEGKKKAKYLVRNIAAKQLKYGKEMVFIINTADLSTEQITEMYTSRWAIEVFFKFLKQLLNFRYLLNRSENSIKIVLYIKMIAAVFLEACKRSNGMSGYKISMLKMSQEIEEDLIKQLFTLCGGNLDQLYGVLTAKYT